jgi:hypothetical protein
MGLLRHDKKEIWRKIALSKVLIQPGENINKKKLSVNHSYLSLDLYFFILFNCIDFGDMFRHQVPKST